MTVHAFIVGVCMLGWHNRANRLCHLVRFTKVAEPVFKPVLVYIRVHAIKILIV